MTEDWVFERTGSFWKRPLYERVWFNVKYWFKGAWCFLQALSSHQESIVENEFTLGDAWHLCLSMQEARMGKTLSMKKVQSSDTTTKVEE